MLNFFEEFRFNISNRCPLKCTYCTVSSDDIQIMNSATFKRGMDFIESITTIPGRRVQLFGAGEPLCAIETLKSFFKDYENPLGFKFELITNGLLLTPDTISFLEENQIEIHLSLDGTKEIHDSHRRTRAGNAPTWDIIMKNLEYLTKPLQGLICTMASDTIDKMPYMYNSLQKIYTENFFLNFDKFDNYSEDQKARYLQHLRNFCDRDYYLTSDDQIKFKGRGASCANFLLAKKYLNPNVFKTFRETAKDLIIDINGDLQLDLPQHTSQMAKSARELGFLTPFGNIFGQIDWAFCQQIKQKYGDHFEQIYFSNESPNKCQNCSNKFLCQPFGEKEIPYEINDNCCFYYKTTTYPYFYLRSKKND